MTKLHPSKLQPSSALVVGGSGFLGSALVDALRAQQVNTTIYARNPGRFHSAGEGLTLVQGDLADARQLTPVLNEHDVVFYLPWGSNPAASWNHPLEEIENNLRACVHVFEQAAEAGVKKMVFPSSGGTVYGSAGYDVLETQLTRPFSPYGIGKLAAEHFLNYTCSRSTMSADIYRVSNLYGPRQSLEKRQGVIGIWLEQIRKGKALQVFGDETTVRDYIHVEDAATLMTHSLRDLSSSQTYNLSSGVGVSILELLDMVVDVTGKEVDVVHQPRRDCDNGPIVLNNQKLLRAFPDFVFRDLHDGIASVWNQLATHA